MVKPHRTLRYYYLKLIRLKGDPGSLARGVALGTFIGITPTIPLHTILIIVLSFPLRASKISSLLSSVIVSNPVTFFFQYFSSWYIGNLLLPGTLSWQKLDAVMALITAEASFMAVLTALGNLGSSALIVLVLGGTILATPFTLFFYIVSIKFFKKIERKRADRIARQKAREHSGNQENPETS